MTLPDPSSVPTVPPGPELLDGRWLVVDTRSPAEFATGHIPGAHSVPLFDDAERAMIGTLYKHHGPSAAIERGLETVHPKLEQLIAAAHTLHTAHPGRPMVVHCWRGGMRSGSVSWLFQEHGLPVSRLDGGYKAYRKWAREGLAAPRPYVILGGMTGVGKTPILAALAEQGEAVLDLEGLARHLGSAFGNLDRHRQPTTEQFSNDVHATLERMPGDVRRVWVEDESRRVGGVNVPEELYERMRKAPYVEVERPDGERLDQLCAIYGGADVGALKAAFERVRQKLGGQNVLAAHEALDRNDLRSAAAIGLRYYDKLYRHTQSRQPRARRTTFAAEGLTADEVARALRDLAFP